MAILSRAGQTVLSFVFWLERPRKHSRREQTEEAREVAREVPGDMVPNDRSCRSETIKSKQAICQQLGTGSARTDRVVPRKAWKFCPGREGARTREDSWYGSQSKENPSKQESGPSSWEDPGRCARGTLSSALSSKDVVRGLGIKSEHVGTPGKPSVKPYKKPSVP